MEFLCTLSQKNVNISAQGVRILDSKPVLKTSFNSTNNFRTRKWDLTTEYLSKEALKLTDVEKTQTFEKFCEGKKQIEFQWNLFGTPGTIPELSPILVFFDNFVRLEMASREPCATTEFTINRSYLHFDNFHLKKLANLQIT